MLRTTFATAALCALASPLAAQSFSYPDFGSTAGLNLLGNAAQSGTALRITDNATNQSGWAWRQTAYPVVNGFDTTFTFRITPPAVGKAEGMAFVLHDDPNGAATLGGTIWGMGYGVGANLSPGIRNSIAIEFDTYQDGFLGDTSANELTIHTRGATGNSENEAYSIGRNTPAANLADAQVHSLRILYVPGTIQVFVDGAATPAISRSYDFVTGGLYLNNAPAPGVNMQNGTAFLGFCGTTGANSSLTERVEILSWDWTSSPLADPCYAGTLGVDTLTVDGSAGDIFRRLQLATYQGFTVALADPPAFGPGAPYILFASLLPQPGALGTALGFGNTCFPVLPYGPAELVVADTIGLFPALLPASPTPHAITVPQGVITFPLELTFQAVTFASAAPLGFGVTNAIEVAWAPSGPPAITSVAPLSTAVGQQVTVSGTNFVPGATVVVNGGPVPATVVTPTQVTFAYPANVGCGSSLAVVNPDGQSATAPLNPTPTVTSTALATGPAAGNAIFVVTGTGFAAGTTVTIGGSPAIVQGVTATSLVLRTPAGSPGVAQVVITTPGGCSTTTSYTYQ